MCPRICYNFFTSSPTSFASQDMALLKSYWKTWKIATDDVLFYVYDECHYFLSDALFNSGTNFWTSAIIRSDPGTQRGSTCHDRYARTV